MKLRNLLSWSVPLVSVLSLAALGGQEGAARGAGESKGLVPVLPGLRGAGAAGEDPEAAAASAGDFDAARWRERLSAADLERREESYAELLRRARTGRDRQDVRAFLEGLSRDGGEPELAWTARLALRELSRAPGLLGLTDLHDPWLETFLQGVPGRALALPLSRQGAWGVPTVPGTHERGTHEKGRSVNIQRDGDGWRIEITEHVDGEQRTRSFQGESLEAILEANPELDSELGISSGLGRPGGFRMQLDLGGRGRLDLDEAFQNFDAFQTFRPFGGFEFPTGTDLDRRLEFFFHPQGASRPVRTDVLGVRVGPPVPRELARRYGVPEDEGIYVSSVHPGTIAHLLGVGSGDVLLRLNGRVLRHDPDITEVMRGRPADGELVLEWVDALGERQTRTWTPAQADEER